MVQNSKTRYLVRIGVLSALAFVIMLLEMPIGFADFLKLDFSDLIAMIGGITMGPLAALLIELVKNLLKAVIITRTGFVGEYANFVVGAAFVVPASFLYHRIKKDKGLIIGLLVGILSLVVVACITNYFIFLPLWGMNYEGAHTDKINLIYTALLPFNFVKGVVISVVTLIAHKGLKPIYRYIV